ncbi:hypothetical protein BOQ62_11790 [Chryseobacterium sp. CH21]|uniref:hypothetical protein n=1 Tax=Chryseobacterium sp. CH21 TaxID=713556 RepID=UPI00100A522A|nr:hypothetical protein [Chryseobacterium sp. CH21]RXM39418.1 hypothetical protein BOQ62_11790 [Chryseobacterium sp. CH21]
MRNFFTAFFTLLLAVNSISLKAQAITHGQTVNVNEFAVIHNFINKVSTTGSGENLDRYKIASSVFNNLGKTVNQRMGRATQLLNEYAFGCLIVEMPWLRL